MLSPRVHMHMLKFLCMHIRMCTYTLHNDSNKAGSDIDINGKAADALLLFAWWAWFVHVQCASWFMWHSLAPCVSENLRQAIPGTVWMKIICKCFHMISHIVFICVLYVTHIFKYFHMFSHICHVSQLTIFTCLWKRKSYDEPFFRIKKKGKNAINASKS